MPAVSAQTAQAISFENTLLASNHSPTEAVASKAPSLIDLGCATLSINGSDFALLLKRDPSPDPEDQPIVKKLDPLVLEEIKKIRERFQKKVKPLPPTPASDYITAFKADALRRILGHDAAAPSQYLVCVDRNPAKQLIMLGYYSAETGRIYDLGWSLVSTGNANRKKHFQTPTGVFENTRDNPNYRALGTRNSKGWRGLGLKDSRAFDFGWQLTSDKKGGQREIRLMMHATDPGGGEARLGHIASEGCVRISNSLNKLIDILSILDKHYLARPDFMPWLLRPEREPVSAPGSLMLVLDSRQFAEPGHPDRLKR